MSNSYYNHGSYPTTGAPGTSASLRSELDSITSGFNLLPTISGNGSKAVVVNSGATALTVTTGTLALAGNFATTGAYNTTLIQGATTSLTLPLVSGTLATLAGTEEFTNKTLTSEVAKGTWTTSGTWTLPALTLGGAITYGGVTLSNAVTGTGNMVLSASPTLTGTIAAASQTLSGTLSVTGVATFTAQPIMSSLTASKPVFTDASKGLTSTGTLAYDQGGTGQTSYAAGDIVYASGVNTLAKLTIGTTGQRLVVAAGLPSWATDTTIGTVTSVGWTGGIVSVATGTTTPAFTIAGTNGGIPYFSSASTWASSTLLAANALMIGGGAGAAPSTITTGAGVNTALGIAPGAVGGMVLTGGAFSGTSVTASSLTSGRVTYAGTAGLLQDSANLTFNGTTLTAAGFSGPISGVVTSTSITDSGLTSGRVTYAGTGGLLQDSANLTFNGTTLTANTIGAFTLGGTVAGGGNQLNNVIIGTTTPLAGAFTTLSATGAITSTVTSGEAFKIGSSTAGTGVLYMDMFNTSGGLYLGLEGSAGGTLWTGIPAYATGLGARTTGGGISFSANSTAQHMLLTTTGLAVTGTLSTTGTVTFNGTEFRLNNNAGGQIIGYTGSAYRSLTYDALSHIFQSSGVSVATVSSTGLAVTGTLSATGAITSTLATGQWLGNNSGNTTILYSIVNNSGGYLYQGVSSSTGGGWAAGLNSNYASVLGTLGATDLIFGTQNVGRMNLDSSGNLGLGVTPSAASVKTFEIGTIGNGIESRAAAITGLTQNTYFNTTFKYAVTGRPSSAFELDTGAFYWYTAASGTAGNNISFTQAMTLDASGNLLVGATAVGNGGKLYVNGSISLGTSTTGAQSSMAKDTTQLTTSISTSATTIYTDIASGMSSASAGYFIIYGSNNAGAGFMDVVIAKASGTPVVVSSSTVEGSPAARTYSVSSYALRLTMASGTYSVNLKATVIGYPF